MAITITGAVGLLSQKVMPGDQVSPISVNGVIGANLLESSAETPVPLVQGVDYDMLQVTEIVSDTSFMFDAYLAGQALGMTAVNLIDTFTYNIIHNNTKQEQIANLIKLAASYASKRILGVWPPKADWSDGNGGLVTLDGSALCAALAGAMSSYPAQQSFTNLPFAGPNKLYYSNTYFTKKELAQLSAGGVLVLVQDAVGGNIYARQQVTTDMTSIQTQEFSVTKAVDKVSFDLYNLVKPFIGKYNITQNLLSGLTDKITTYLFNAQNISAPMCGSLILSSKNLSLRANLNGANTDLVQGTVAIALTVEVGYPANFIDITLNVE